MTPLGLLHTEAGVVLAGAACLVGYVAGMLMIVLVCWRRITHRAGAEVRLLRMTADDLQARVTLLTERADDLARMCHAKQDTINEQTAQIGQLYKDVDKMARLACDEAAKRKKAESV